VVLIVSLGAAPVRTAPSTGTPLTEAAVDALFDRLYELPPNHDELGDPRPVIVPLTPEGKAAWIDF
jgi:hypothetical protein